MNESIRKKLESMADLDNAAFASNLIPDSRLLLGIRLPMLRTYAKELASKDYRTILFDGSKDKWFEEIMLRGMIMGYGSSKDKDVNAALKYLDTFIPLVDNWTGQFVIVVVSHFLSFKRTGKKSGTIYKNICILIRNSMFV